MKEQLKLSNAIGGIDDRFILEAYEYKRQGANNTRVWKIGIAAAGICLAVGAAVLLYRVDKPSVMVYACDSDQHFAVGQPVLLSGEIDDNGRMRGHPLMFYVLGSEIESIRYSCKNERISFVDWTEQRGDFGLSKNFTVPYGENDEDYYYLVIDWQPEKIIRKLTDHREIGISDLLPEEKEDLIVMEVTYLDGRQETLAINISLSDEGQFTAKVSDYQITDKDDFVFRPDSEPIKNQSGYYEGNLDGKTEEKQALENVDPSNQTPLETSESRVPVIVTLSDEEMAHVDKTINDYYNRIHRKIISYVQVKDPTSFCLREPFTGYEADEIVAFEVTEESSEIKRYITIGSKDGWVSCSVLDEGY